MRVPVQALQIQQVLRHFAVTSLLHSDGAVQALHQTAGTPGVAEDVADPVDSLLAHSACLGQDHRTNWQQTPQSCRLNAFTLQQFGPATKPLLPDGRSTYLGRNRQGS